VRASKLAECLKVLEEYESETTSKPDRVEPTHNRKERAVRNARPTDPTMGSCDS
jgi:hypothetical protein